MYWTVRIRRHTDGDNTISVTWTESVFKLGGAAGPPSPSHGQAPDNHGYAKWNMDVYGYLDG
jgi:hypothetical protein